MRNLTLRREVNVDFTADQWQLYTASFPAAELAAAAQRLNQSLEAAVNSGADRSTVYSTMQTVMNELSSFGAADSEPIWFLQDVMEEIYGENR